MIFVECMKVVANRDAGAGFNRAGRNGNASGI
jgi:hypothetical protein